jgi:tRNA pseudouridine55 synthase
VAPQFTREQLETALAPFRGSFLQTPPPYSAKKIAGTPAYRLARKHVPVALRPVEVKVLALDLVEFAGDTARLTVHCSTGTYLRSIAHDLGQKLGCGAHLENLRRTSSGDFTEDQARTLDQLSILAAAGAFDQAIVPASRLLPDFPNATVDAVTVAQIRQGKDFRLSPFIDRAGARHVKAVSQEGDLIAIGEARLPHLYHPILVL